MASAGTVGACVGEKDSESASQQELCVANHADAIVGETVEENCGVSVTATRLDAPSAESGGVWRDEGNIFEIGVETVGDLAHTEFVFLR